MTFTCLGSTLAWFLQSIHCWHPCQCYFPGVYPKITPLNHQWQWLQLFLFFVGILWCYTQRFCSKSSNLGPFWSRRRDGMGMIGDDELGIGGFVKGLGIILSSIHPWGVFSIVHDYRHRVPSTLLSSCVFSLVSIHIWLPKWEQLSIMRNFPTLKYCHLPSSWLAGIPYPLEPPTWKTQLHPKQRSSFPISQATSTTTTTTTTTTTRSTRLYCPSLGVSFAATSNIFLHGSTPRTLKWLERLLHFKWLFCKTKTPIWYLVRIFSR